MVYRCVSRLASAANLHPTRVSQENEESGLREQEGSAQNEAESAITNCARCDSGGACNEGEREIKPVKPARYG